MCNDYEQHVAWPDYRKAIEQLELGIPTHKSERDLPLADDIRVDEVGAVMRAAGNGVELVPVPSASRRRARAAARSFNF